MTIYGWKVYPPMRRGMWDSYHVSKGRVSRRCACHMIGLFIRLYSTHTRSLAHSLQPSGTGAQAKDKEDESRDRGRRSCCEWGCVDTRSPLCRNSSVRW